jgi:AcrR family transcriptional regulator
VPAKAHSAAVRPYHHRHLRQALLDAALRAIADRGPAALSLRDLARMAGVSHAAPAHHFRDKADLLTALATDGFLKLDATLRAAQPRGFLEVGVAYVRFAVEQRAYFEVMYRPELYHRDDPALVAAREAAGRSLYPLAARSRGAPPDSAEALNAAIAAWSLVHGLATLWLAGNLPPALGDDPEVVARRVAAQLFAPGG